jgi:hypothetical protein
MPVKIFSRIVSPTLHLEIDLWHVLLTLGAAFWGGFQGYIQSHASSIPAALGDKSAAETLIANAVAYALVAVVLMAKQSFLKQIGGGTGGNASNATPPTDPATPPPPPPPVVSTRSRFSPPNAPAFLMALTIGAVAVFSAVFLIGSTTACNPPKTPLLSTLEQTVENDLAKGDSDAQIASDVCSDLGGTALTDAVCAGAWILASDIVTTLLDLDAINSSDAGPPSTQLPAKVRYAARAFLTRHPVPKPPAE